MNTRARIDREVFYKLNDKDLLRSIFPEDFIKTIRGQHYSYKQQALSNLSKEQYSIFMFMIIYFHNIFGWESFLTQYSYEANNGAFEEYKSGMEYLGDTKMLNIISRCEYNYKNYGDLQKKQKVYDDLNDEYEQLKNESLRNAANFIRKHPEKFVVF
jgi:hypothetical protein